MEIDVRVRLILVAVTIAVSVPACLWDYDTLSMEAKGMPDAVDAIIGRFDRNPPLYYQLRLERVEREIDSSLGSVDLYDDAAVACDRLGRSDEGLDWLARKRDVLLDTDPEQEREQDWYRYYANLGTLRVHKWARNGMPLSDVHELEMAIDEIEQAIEINPEAHFGREYVQLGLMRMLLAHMNGDEDLEEDAFAAILDGRSREEVVEGLVGLVTLGAAWESPDVFIVLSTSRLMHRHQSIQVIAGMRVSELLASGRESVFKDCPTFRYERLTEPSTAGMSEKELRAAYAALRANADEYHRARTDFMESRLRAGKHPDTHPDFWDGYREVPPVDLRQFEPLIARRWYASWEARLAFAILGLTGLVVIAVILSRRVRARTKARRSSDGPM